MIVLTLTHHALLSQHLLCGSKPVARDGPECPSGGGESPCRRLTRVSSSLRRLEWAWLAAAELLMVALLRRAGDESS